VDSTKHGLMCSVLSTGGQLQDKRWRSQSYTITILVRGEIEWFGLKENGKNNIGPLLTEARSCCTVEFENINIGDGILTASLELRIICLVIRRNGARILNKIDSCSCSTVKVRLIIEVLLRCTERDVNIVVSATELVLGDIITETFDCSFCNLIDAMVNLAVAHTDAECMGCVKGPSREPITAEIHSKKFLQFTSTLRPRK
jgi:hypothetical protein